MNDWKEQVKQFQELRKSQMPPSAEVVAEAVQRIGLLDKDSKEVRANFDILLRELFETTLVVLEEHEEHIDARLVLPQLARQFLRKHPKVKTIEGFLQRAFPALKAYFLSIRQSRMARGGRDLELQIDHLLRRAEIPFEAQPRRERADFILPSLSYLNQHKPKAIILSVKRTLRERWGEVVEELVRFTCPNVYLATTEEKINPVVLKGIKRHNLHLVVWQNVKNGRYKNQSFVLGFDDFIKLVTGFFMPRWT